MTDVGGAVVLLHVILSFWLCLCISLATGTMEAPGMTAVALYFCSMLLMITWLDTSVGDSWMTDVAL
jgi:hypothetical protein